MSWEDEDFDFGGPVGSEEEEDEALAPPKPVEVAKPAVAAQPKKAKGKKLREIKAEQKRLKQEQIDAEMKAQRQREREIRLKLGQNASQRDIQNALADENSLREVQDLFGNAMGLADDDEEEDYGVTPEAAAHLSAPKAAKAGGVSLADEAAQFNGPVEHALAVLKIIGVSEHEEFGEKLGDKLVEDNNIENAVGLMSALAKALKPLLTSKEYSDLAKVANVLRNDKMAEEKLARGKKKKKNKKPKVQTVREGDIAAMGAGDYYEDDTYYDQYW